ncbi:MAG: hypothetical protein ACT4O6_18305 [Reyranella sp.]
MSKPESRGPGRAPLPKARVNAFFHYLGRTGSVTVAANRAQLRRSTLYQKRQDDEDFAERWARALDLGVERLQDNAMNRVMNGTPKPIYRNGRQVGSVQQFDNRLLQFLLKAHRPDLYGDRKNAGLSPLPFDLAKRLAAARPRADAHDARRAEEKRRAESDKRAD